MPSAVIFNVSALIPPKNSEDVSVSILSLISKEAALNWPSLLAFAKLYQNYAPINNDPLTNCCGLFALNSLPPSFYWISQQKHVWLSISQYKLGTKTTEVFLKDLLDTFDFLQTKHFDLNTINRLCSHEPVLSSLQGMTEDKLFNNQNIDHNNQKIALALLEEAWLARMVFDSQLINRNLNYYCDIHPNTPLILISNSNELDMVATLQSMQKNCSLIAWKSPEEFNKLIKVPNETLSQGLVLTTHESKIPVTLYPSYGFRAFKNGKDDEHVGLKTNELISFVLEK